jgi:imidazolonepropionase-like amidohydrolase
MVSKHAEKPNRLRQLIGAYSLLALAMMWSIANGAPGRPLTVVWAGTLLSVPGEKPSAQQSILIRDGKIERIASGYLSASELKVASENVETLDLSKLYVLPGLFDLHVHLTTEPGPAATLEGATSNSAGLALVAAANAEKTLRAGFTTVLDMGTGTRAHELAIYAVRDAIQSGREEGPRILAVGSPICAPNQCRTSQVEPGSGKPPGECSSADDCQRVVREQIRRGADVINFYNTGSLLAPGAPAQTFPKDTMRAIVATAHAMHRKVVADGAGTRTSAAGINEAIGAGADWIDTGIYPDRTTWQLLAKSHKYYAPHLYAVVAAVGDTPQTLSSGSMGWLPEPVLKSLWKLKLERPAAVEAIKLNVDMVFASDAGVFAHGRNASEFVEYVKLGLTPAQAIATATVNAARALGLNGDSGSIEPGKRADLIGIATDPLRDIRELQRIQVVIAAGRVVDMGRGS